MQVIKDHRPRNYDRGTFSILETLDVDSLKRTVIKEFEDTVEAPNWTQDGKYLIYNRNGKLYRHELSNGDTTEIYTGSMTDCNNDHVISPCGKFIAISHFTHEDRQSRIYTLPITGGEPSLITPIAPSFLHGWSPDGKFLAYTAERNGQWDIHAIPVIGGREIQLTDGAYLDDGPEYSPCGKYIWFNSTRSGLMQVWRMDADGGNQTQITFDEANSWFPHPSPNNERIAYIAYKKGDVEPDKHPANREVELRLMPISGGEYKVIAELFGGQGTINVNSWSPDNKTIAFVSYRLR